MRQLSYIDIRTRYLDLMKQHGHAEIPGASLVPEDDPSMLFVGAGMVPLVPYLVGEKHPSGTRLTDVQRCLRTIDIDEVGDETHCTTFEMLGNWSLNDYFKEEAINFTVSFFLEVLGLSIDSIYVSVFSGNENAPRDEESIRVWQSIFNAHKIKAEIGKNERIQLYDKECWWELEVGGPCGPCSEIFIDTGKDACGPDCHLNCNCGKYIELGNNVFMEYLKRGNEYSPLGRHNVDFGGGLERQVMMSQKKESVFETDMYQPILEKVQKISHTDTIRSQRIIADHIKAATWIVMDGVTPGRTEQGYVLRRLIRRAVRHGRMLGIEDSFTQDIAAIAIDQFTPIYPILAKKKTDIIETISEEEERFRKTIQSGLKKFDQLLTEKGDLSGEDAFYLYETYGFPVEITKEMLDEKGKSFDIKEFDHAYQAHQNKSRTAAAGFFKGGLADTSDISKRYHTATHLLHAALRKVLGEHVYQKGSNINPERLRFDFPSDRKLTPEEIAEVEQIVNKKITESLDVHSTEMQKEDALKIVPHAAFSEKYGNTVKVYSIGEEPEVFSREICGGPHVQNTSELGTFKIIKQENVGAGVKRIKAILT